MRRRRRRQAALLLAIALSAPASKAQAANHLPWVTGERLVKMMGNIDPATVHWTPESPFRSRAIAAEFRDLANGEFVHGYIQAVHDATEGKAWCWSQFKPKPHELDADVRHYLQRMTDAQLKRSAADLIVEHWSSKFPCVVDSRGGKK